jgi:hypothetical protein
MNISPGLVSGRCRSRLKSRDVEFKISAAEDRGSYNDIAANTAAYYDNTDI